MYLFDGAMGSYFIEKGVKLDAQKPFSLLSLENPKLLLEMHKLYISRGSSIIKTNTFNADLNTLLALYPLPIIKTINQKAIELAFQAIHELKVEGVSVAGSIGPSPKRITDENEAVMGKVFSDSAYLQAYEMLLGGVDYLLLETMLSLREIRYLLDGIERAFLAFKQLKVTHKRVKVIVSMTPNQEGDFVFDGELKELEAWREMGKFDYLGFNCGQGFSSFSMAMSQVKKVDYFAPNLGFPVVEKGQWVYKKTIPEFITEVKSLINGRNIQFLGGCCGCHGEHIEALQKSISTLCHS